MKNFCFVIRPEVDVDTACEELEKLGCSILYSSEGERKEVYGAFSQTFSPSQYSFLAKWVESISPTDLQDIDWASQWALHGNDFHEGFVHVHVASRVIKLKPGPGFGDFSHPTTRLIVRLMDPHVKDKHVIDLGCGSGILSLAAAAMGARSVHGLDIDSKAVLHAKGNSKINQMQEIVSFGHASEFQVCSSKPTNIVLMNMVQSEQCEAWKSISQAHPQIREVVTSGILESGHEEYLKLVKSWNWQITETIEEAGWLAYRFSI